ncbi:hypothetical protein F4806DRAFT_504811 [Annulohypoxylon nitens]|nr:hypothetical protein F4806DRAFT_504811 [Annulohypoxylon nitens]
MSDNLVFGISATDAVALKKLGINHESHESPTVFGAAEFSSDCEMIKGLPSTEDISLSVQEWYKATNVDSQQSLDGSKALHLLEVYSLVEPIYASRLPSIGDLMKKVWYLVPADLRKTIKEKARKATPEDKADIAQSITSYIARVLAIIGIPSIIIKILLGPLVRKVVDWIVKNVNELPD